MSSVIKFTSCIILAGIFIFFSCKKEYSLESNFNSDNQPPIANAGNDTIFTSTSITIYLDGTASKDPDGSISGYLWRKIAGPAAISIVNPAKSKTEIKNLVAGAYSFELKVTDNKGLSAKDTVVITISTGQNRAPIANAGSDQTIILPISEATLDGSASSDPDNNISAYLWTKISGPSSSNMVNAQTAKTLVTNLSEGVYQFELTVTDSTGLSSKDTVFITVNGECLITNAALNPIGLLSLARYDMVRASAGGKILFAGGQNANGLSTRVDIYDISTNLWSTAELSKARYGMVAGSVGNKIFFAGGYPDLNNVTTRVDIYDADANTWSTAELSEGRALLSAASAGNKILFAGGYKFDGSSRVDIYDNATNKWSVANLSQARWGLSATAAGNKIYVAGGEARNVGGPGIGSSNIVNTIDIYDVLADTWSVSTLGEAKGYMASIASEGKVYWAGGASSISAVTKDYEFSNKVEIRNINTNSSSYVQLCSPVAGIDAIAVNKDNTLAFFSGFGFPGYTPENKFDIYNITSNKWSTGLLPKNITGEAIISVGNVIYVAGGNVNGTLSNQVWTLEY